MGRRPKVDNTKKFIMNHVLLFVAIVGLASILGCPSGGPSMPAPGTGGTAALPKKVKDCLVPKKIKLKGVYKAAGFLIEVDREATLTEDFFEVNTEANDELAEKKKKKAKVEEWKAPLVIVTDGGSNWYGYNDETEEVCHKVTYERGPFDGPGGKCSIKFEATVCEDTCTIKNATWVLKCGVKKDGTGGTVKAEGTWTVEEP